MTIGTKIKKLRSEAGLTQTELGEKLCLPTSVVSSYETGYRNPPLKVVAEIAYLFNITTDWLLGVNNARESLDLTGFDDSEIRVIRSLIGSLRA